MILQLFEDSGPLLGGEPTERHEVINIGWKNSGLPESTPFVEYPLNRPNRSLLTLSYQKYNYLKISNIEGVATRVRIAFEKNPAIVEQYDVRLFYKLTNVYQQPTNTLLTGSMYTPTEAYCSDQTGCMPVIFPRLSTNDPQDATTHIRWMQPNTTYYTEYFVTQLYVNPGDWDNYGNLGADAIKIRFFVDNYEEAVD